jgi:hypothetical protein
MNGGEEECIEDIGGKTRWKDTTGKTKGVEVWTCGQY